MVSEILVDVIMVARDVVVKAGQGVGQGQEEEEESSSSSSSSLSSSSSSSSEEEEGDEGGQGKGDEGKTITGSWKVINVYLEEDQGGEKVKVRRYKCLGKGCGEICNSWSACDAHINKKHLNQVYGPCHDQKLSHSLTITGTPSLPMLKNAKMQMNRNIKLNKG